MCSQVKLIKLYTCSSNILWTFFYFLALSTYTDCMSVSGYLLSHEGMKKDDNQTGRIIKTNYYIKK